MNENPPIRKLKIVQKKTRMIDKLQYIASQIAKENMNAQIAPAHLFKALLNKEFGLVSVIEKDLDSDYYYLVDWADMQIRGCEKSMPPVSEPPLSDTSEDVLREAENYRLKLDEEELTPLCLFASLITPGVGFSFEQLKTFPISVNQLLTLKGAPAYNNIVESPAVHSASTSSLLGKYCVNKNAERMQADKQSVIGFEHEISVFFEILGRKTKSNLLITGESGVGKTALVNGFVDRIISGDVPSLLKNSIVYELDLALLSSDANYKGEMEDRFKNVIAEIEQNESAILFIESVDKIMDKNGMLYGLTNILKQTLNRQNLMLICTSSVDGYTKNVETDKEFLRQFEVIRLEEPNAEQCYRIVRGSIDSFEKYHGIAVADVVIHDAIRLAKRYLNDKALPDSVFDLIDRTMALIKTMNDVSEQDITALHQKLSDLEAKSEENSPEILSTELNWLHYELFNKVSCLLLAQLDDETDFAKIGSVQDKINYLKETLAKLSRLCETKRFSLESSDLYAVIARQTGIPMGKVQSKERDKLTNAEDTLRKRVVGQDHAIKVILDAVYESRSGLNKKGQPMGSFFFLGPTGTGKTELTKALAEFLFQEESAMIRFDMSEFKEEHSVALLYGAPPGYVGYEEGGLLVNKIRQKPYSVVLFDEIEKAHRSVFDLFLQILDEGKLHDRLGRVGDFSNALIIFTSNIGSQFIVDSFGKGVIPKSTDLMEIMQGNFRPEFLGRLTEIVPFSPITEKIVTMIFDIHLKGLVKLLDEQNIKLQMEEDTKRTIAMKGYNAQFGARPIIGIIRKELRRPLSKMIISGQLESGDTAVVTTQGDEIVIVAQKQ